MYKTTVFLCLLLLTACQLPNTVPPSEKQSNTVEAINNSQLWAGVLEKAEVNSYMYGTHVLNGYPLSGDTATFGKTTPFAISSKAIDLDGWVGKKVIVMGKLVDGYPVENGPPFIEVHQIEEDQKIKTQ
jgi:hypothetical protein